MRNNILIVEDDIAFCNMLKAFLSKKGFHITVAYSVDSAFKEMDAVTYQVILSDIRLPVKEGTEILKKVVSENLRSQVILMTGYAEINKAVEAMKIGAFDYISKPVSPETLLDTIHAAIEKNKTKVLKSNHPEKAPKDKVEKKVKNATAVQGISDASKKLYDYIRLVAPTKMSVLIMGESGTGKEYIAKRIHDLSKRNSGPFIAVDCGAIPKEIASSEFFGHIKGSFTGAINNKTGHFEAANDGTLFLDEIGNLGYDLQIKLLRALQERKIKPVGSNTEIEVDIRVIAATNEDLEIAVKKGTFREDLYHRLNEFSVKVPPLVERKEDIILFADFFLEKANNELEKNIIGLENEVLDVFKKYSWPGNLREMQNTIKRAVLLSQTDYISTPHLPQEILNHTEGKVENYSLFKNENEKELIIDAINKANGNKSKAARLLEIDRKTLYNKLKQYNITT